MAIEARAVRTEERDGRAWLTPDEAAMFSGWRASHGHPDIPPDILPRLGVVAVLDGEDSAAGWLYMDNSVGVGFVEWLVTRPGLMPSQARRCLSVVLTTLAVEAKTLGYGLLLGHCIDPLARVAVEHLGWHDMGSPPAKALALPLV